MKKYKTWLEEHGFSDSSVLIISQSLSYWKKWCNQEGLDLNHLTYKEIMDYVGFNQENGIATATINNRLTALNHYNRYLQDEGVKEDNPAIKVRIKDTKARIKSILSKEELRKLCDQYPSKENWQLSNKVILSFVIFQGCNASTLKAIKTFDLNLEQGRIHLPQTKRINARNLPLEPAQIFLIQKYLIKRAEISSYSETLFPNEMDNTLQLLKHQLHRINPKVENIRQLRASTIVNWLKVYNIREVQYFCGHRSIISTENYLMQDVEELRKTLGDFHPLGT